MVCFEVLRPVLNPTCSSAKIFSAHCFSPFSPIFNMTLLGWLISLMVRLVWEGCMLPFLRSVIIRDCVQGVGHHLVCQIVLSAIILSARSCCRPSSCLPDLVVVHHPVCQILLSAIILSARSCCRPSSGLSARSCCRPSSFLPDRVVGHHPVCQIVLSAIILSARSCCRPSSCLPDRVADGSQNAYYGLSPVCINSPGMLTTPAD